MQAEKEHDEDHTLIPNTSYTLQWSCLRRQIWPCA